MGVSTTRPIINIRLRRLWFGCEDSNFFAQGKTNLQNPARKRTNYFIGSVLECRKFLRILQLFPWKVKPMTFIDKPFEPCILSRPRKCSLRKARSSPNTSRTRGRCGLVGASMKETSETLCMAMKLRSSNLQ